MALKIIWQEEIVEGKFLTMSNLILEWWKKYEVVGRKNNTWAVAWVIRNTSNDSIVLIDQYRYPLQRRVIELVAWLMDKNKAPKQTMIEEIIEETGYTNIDRISYVWETSGSAGMSRETTKVYDIEVSGERWTQSLEWTEDINVIEIPEADIRKYLSSKMKEWHIIDPKVYMSL